jgi:hypothetical protein
VTPRFVLDGEIAMPDALSKSRGIKRPAEISYRDHDAALDSVRRLHKDAASVPAGERKPACPRLLAKRFFRPPLLFQREKRPAPANNRSIFCPL